MDPQKIKLGIAPIAWTNDDIPELGSENNFEQCVSEMALAGFVGSEVGTKYPSDPALLKRALDLRNLRICNRWHSTFIIRDGYKEAERIFRDQLHFLRLVGADIIGPSEQTDSCQGHQTLGVLAGKGRFDEEGWKVLTKGMNALGKIAREEGFRLCYHHHMGTGIQNGPEVDRFLEETDPENVFLTFDSGHFSYAGFDPVQQLKKYISRVGHVHLKDIRHDVLQKAQKEDWPFLRAVREGIFTVPGDGMIDFPALFALLDQANYRGWMVVEAEQDPAKANAFEYAKMARAYIKDKTGL